MVTLISKPAEAARHVCLGWVLTRGDGFTLRLTGHDKPLTIVGETYEPGAALEASSFTRTTDLEPGHASVRGALDAEAITEEDILTGTWDGARVDVYRLDWLALSVIELIWSGRLARVEWQGERFEADLVSLKVDLDRLIGRQFLRQCDAVLGDARCGVDLENPAFEGLICDQQLTTCIETFANVENFRGFPHMPGNDFILAGPAAGTGE
ncbi:MAG: DUF2163 domain-containing protein [Hyphomonadaceae bacterium]|nr:DUF2163 domain-containing protein [Hyphomonadaceae bacterium]